MLNKTLVVGKRKVAFFDLHQRFEPVTMKKELASLRYNRFHYSMFRYDAPEFVHMSSILSHKQHPFRPAENSMMYNALDAFAEVAGVEDGDQVVTFVRRDTCGQRSDMVDVSGLTDITNWKNFDMANCVGVLGVSRENILGGNCLLRDGDGELLMDTHVSSAHLVAFKDPDIEMKLGPIRSFDGRNSGFRDLVVLVHLRQSN